MDPSDQPREPLDAAACSRPADSEPRQIHVVRWSDPIVEARGFDLRSRYVETFWLPVLGPSATLLLRRFAAELEVAPGGVDLDSDLLARALGLGITSGRRAPFRRAITRCVRFGTVRMHGNGTLAVRRRLAPVPSRHIAALPPVLQELHRTWPGATHAAPRPGVPDHAQMLGQPPWSAGARMARPSHASNASSESAPT